MANRVLSIDVGELTSAMNYIVEDEIGNISKATKQAVTKACDTIIESLRRDSPEKTGVYAAGWDKDITGNDLVGYQGTVYQALKPSLTHLLENGHGGPAPAPPHPHIAPAFDDGVRAFEKELERGMR